MHITEAIRHYVIQFDKEDFQNGLIYEATAIIKELPRHHWKYDGNKKLWWVTKGEGIRQALEACEKRVKEKDAKIHQPMEEFDVEGWKDEVFGEPGQEKFEIDWDNDNG